MNTTKSQAMLAAALMLAALAGCHKKDDDTVGAPGPAEQAGRRLDQVTDKTGRELTRAAEQANQQVQDAAQATREHIDQATDAAGHEMDKVTDATGKKLEQAGEKLQERARENENK